MSHVFSFIFILCYFSRCILVVVWCAGFLMAGFGSLSLLSLDLNSHLLYILIYKY